MTFLLDFATLKSCLVRHTAEAVPSVASSTFELRCPLLRLLNHSDWATRLVQ